MERVSRQMAPWIKISGNNESGAHKTYCLAADVWMPHLGVEFHDRRTEWVLLGNRDVDDKCASFVGGSWRTLKASLEMRDVLAVAGWSSRYLGYLVRMDIRNLLGHPASSIGGHFTRLKCQATSVWST